MKQERYTQAQVQAFENGAIMTPERNISGLKKGGGVGKRRDGWSAAAKTRCKKFALGIQHRKYSGEGDQAYAVTLTLPLGINRWIGTGKNKTIAGPITGAMFKHTLNKLLDNLIPRGGQPTSLLNPWKRVFWVIELRENDATPHIHAIVWTDQTERIVIERTQERWASLWEEHNIIITKPCVHIRQTNDVIGWIEYMLKLNASSKKKKQQEYLKYLIGIGNVWGRRPMNMFETTDAYKAKLDNSQMYRVRRIALRFKIRQEELRGSKPENIRTIKRLRSAISCSYLKQADAREAGMKLEMLKAQRSSAYSLTLFGFDEALVKRLIDYIRLADIRNEDE